MDRNSHAFGLRHDAHISPQSMCLPTLLPPCLLLATAQGVPRLDVCAAAAAAAAAVAAAAWASV